jgi:hypothetical protein
MQILNVGKVILLYLHKFLKFSFIYIYIYFFTGSGHALPNEQAERYNNLLDFHFRKSGLINTNDYS